MRRAPLPLAVLATLLATPSRAGDGETLMFIVAARDLYQGLTIEEDDLFAVEMSREVAEQSGLFDDVYQSPEHVVGRIPSSRILANEFIREERLADALPDDLATQVPRGMRALALPTSAAEVRTIRRGNYVDLFGRLQRADGPLVCELTQGTYVLSTSETTRAAAPTLVFAFTPEQALVATWVLANGTVELALRNDLDVGYAKLDLPLCDPSLLATP